MRLRLRPLDATADAVPVLGSPRPLALWHHRLDWTCAGTRLDLRILAAEAFPLPEPEPSEPVPGAIARVVRSLAGQGALALLANPAEALGPARIAFAEGVRLMSIAAEADEACWDAILGLGQPCYGVRGEVVVEVVNPRPAGVLSALSFGVFYCHEGLEPTSLDEDRQGVAWQAAEPVEATVFARGGFAVARQSGSEGRYADRGNEGSVRVVLRAGTRSCWSQPRFVAPRKDACAH